MSVTQFKKFSAALWGLHLGFGRDGKYRSSIDEGVVVIQMKCGVG